MKGNGVASQRRLRVAVIGAGEMGRMHLEGWRTVRDVELVVVADPDLSRAQTLASQHGIDCVGDWQAAIDRADVDVVSVCVPTCFHPDVTVFAAERGKHVICEKPIALDLAGADRMIEAAERNNVHLTIGLMYRASPATPRLREMVQSGALGRPVYFSLNAAAGIRPKSLMHAEDGNGGPFIDFAVHLIDWWSVLTGSHVDWVSAQGCTWATRAWQHLDRIERFAVDTGSALLRFASGDMADVTLTWGLPHKAKPSQVSYLNGPKGRVIGSPTGPIEVYLDDAHEPTEVIPTTERTLVAEELAVFADALRSGRGPFAPPREVRQVLAVSLAILESMRTRQPVAVADV